MTELATITVRRISDFVTKGTTPTSLGRRFTHQGIRFIKVETIDDNGRCIPEKVAFIDPETHSLLRRSQLREGDILFSIAGALGRSAVVQESWLPANTNQAFAVIRPSRRAKINPRYLLWTLRGYTIQRRVAEINVQAAQANLSLEQVRDFEIPLPSPENQNRIARALDEAEELVAMLERLIAKKKAVKQGMVQQLLTGKTRLPGFSGAWRNGRLGDVLTVRHGRSQRDIEVSSGKYPIFATGGEIGRTDTPLYSKPSVLIGRKGTIDRPQFQATPFWTVDTLFYTEIGAAADPKFLFYVFTTVDWRSMNEASGVPSLSARLIESVSCSFPSVEEQQAIRRALDDTDREIVTIHARLTKAKAIKQGMMQELLSGRTRLPVTEAVAA